MIQKACESYFIWNCLFIWICLAKFEDTSTNNPNPPMNFSWIKENEIAASGGPKNFENLKWIENQGIKHVLSLDQDIFENYQSCLENLNLDAKLIPITDFEAPDADTIEVIIEYLTNVIQKEESLLLHCRAGCGRTGVVLALYLMEFYSKTSTYAIQEIRKNRPCSIETSQQEKSIHNFKRKNISKTINRLFELS